MYRAKSRCFRLTAMLIVLATASFAESRAQTDGTPAAGKTNTAENTDGASDKNNATTVVFKGSEALITGTGTAFSEGTLTIKQPGTYTLSGTLENGQVLVDAGKNDVVRLVLNGVSLRNETGPAIYAKKSKEIVLFLTGKTQNKVSDGARYAEVKDENEPDAAIFVQDSLSIAGDGFLEVTGSHKHGIRAQDILTISGGVISVDSAGDALRGRDGINIQNGNFTIKSAADAIKANNDKDGAKGFVNIAGGAFVIQSKNDGITAKSSLSITGGVFNITTGRGSASPSARINNYRGRFGGGFGRTSAKSSSATSTSMKALKAGKLIHIKGGEFTIDAEDDAVNSGDKVVISSGRFTIKTGDDGIHANNALEISGGDINIVSCFEGLEGVSITISGGNISVVSDDDAVNAADGTANRSRGGGWGGGWGGWPAPNEKMFVRITGGTVDLYCGTDGIDSNGNIFIEGGTIKISGPSSVFDGAIDFDGSMIVTGGEFITAGSVIGVSEGSTQPVILVSYVRQQPPGSVIAIKDSNGKTLLEYESKMQYYMSGFTSPSFKVGETYTLFVDGEKHTDIKLSGIVTGISDNGGYYSGGWGGFGGGWGGGWRR